MKKAIAFSIAAIMMFSSSGCLPTPEEVVIVPKDMERMVQKARETEAGEAAPLPPGGGDYAARCARFGCPERWQAETEAQNGKITFGADVRISLPESAGLPLARVKAGRFSEDMVNRLCGVLCGDTPMYIDSGEMDKEAVMHMIKEKQDNIVWLEANGPEAVDKEKEQLEYWRERYQKAPDKIEHPLWDGSLQTGKLDEKKLKGSYTYLNISAKPGDPSAAVIEVENNPEYVKADDYCCRDEYGNTVIVSPRSYSCFKYFRNGVENVLLKSWHRVDAIRDVTEESLSGEAAESGLTVSPAMARAAAQGLLDKTGLAEDMVIDRIELCEGCQEKTKGKRCYSVRVLRRLSGVSVESRYDYTESEIAGMGVGREWWYESFEIVVTDDGGIAQLFWEGPLDVTEMLSLDAKILSFKDIEAIFIRMLPVVKGDLTRGGKVKSMDFTLEKARLALWRVNEQNAYDTGLLIPVWNFYCAEKTEYYNGDIYASSDYCYDLPSLCVNAVDGTIINTQRGY